ncbi:MAG: hypothetical protein A2293_05855 [Elusimicrobia bacterium RIFOXYB2_FULL_49_7]|nr:MAG: hypothetical protein A2293_05855 [Elusimicrobia bacterium RIFOXYB2_FULL_49_7]
MAAFTYSYVDSFGAKHKATMEGANLGEVEHKLNALNIAVLNVAPASPLLYRSPSVSPEKISNRELIEFCIYLYSLTEAGLSLTLSLREFANETKNGYFKYVIETLQRTVEGGQSLSKGMAQFPKVFSTEFVHLIQAGEQTGTLAQSFKQMRGYIEWMQRVKADIKQATTYPIIVCFVLGVFMLYLFTFVIPKITDMLIEMKIQLPLITRIVMNISNVAVHTWWGWLMLGVMVPVTVRIAVKRSEAFALFLDKLKLQVPLFGNLLTTIIQARFSRNFVILHRAGISIFKNLDLCRGAIGNRLYMRAIEKASQDVRDGKDLSTSLKSSGLFSGLVLRMIAVGESSGGLDSSLEHVAAYYDEEVPRKVKKIFGIIEPLLILTIVSVVGTVALSIFLPILSLSSGIHR